MKAWVPINVKTETVKQYQIFLRDQTENQDDNYAIVNAAAKSKSQGGGQLQILSQKDDLNTVINYKTKAKITQGGGNTQA